MTSHPRDCTRELIDVIARTPKVCNHIHLPVQSGSDRVLQAMNRHYTRSQYLDIVAYAREKIPGVSFTSDIIVGFPGETYEEFLETVSLIQEVGYSSLFTFIYSPREGTAPAKMEDPVPAAEKSRWFQQLLEAQKSCGMRFYEEEVGSVRRVLCEGKGKLKTWDSGRTPCFGRPGGADGTNGAGNGCRFYRRPRTDWTVCGCADYDRGKLGTGRCIGRHRKINGYVPECKISASGTIYC